MIQDFSKKNLMHLVQREDVAKFQLWREPSERHLVIENICSRINDPQYSFPRFSEKQMGGKTVFAAPCGASMLALRKLERNIRSAFRIRKESREDIIVQVKALLEESCQFSVLRLDLKSFYESVDRCSLMNVIEKQSNLSYTSVSLLRKLFACEQFRRRNGLPRGLSVSATLAELSLTSLDKRIRGLPHIYFYSRYVDDLIVFSNAQAKEALEDVRKIIETENHRLSKTKKTLIECSSVKNPASSTCEFNFLGYRFIVRKHPEGNPSRRKASIRLSEEKVKKIKSRIAHSFIDYGRSQDYHLLERRLRFLTSNYTLRKTANGKLKGGIFYNYRHMNCMDDLQDLDRFLSRMVFSQNGSIGSRLQATLTMAQRCSLAKYRFTAGFEKQLSFRLAWGAMADIKKCWLYEKN